MRSGRLNPTILLAMVVAFAAARPVWLLPHAHGDEGPHAHGEEGPHAHCAAVDHHHEHSHGDLIHSHAHHHHSGDSHDEGEPDHDHGILDHPEDAPMARWIAPRRAQIDASPVAPALAVLAEPLPSEWIRSQRHKPPPLADQRASQLISLRTIILRL